MLRIEDTGEVVRLVEMRDSERGVELRLRRLDESFREAAAPVVVFDHTNSVLGRISFDGIGAYGPAQVYYTQGGLWHTLRWEVVTEDGSVDERDIAFRLER